MHASPAILSDFVCGSNVVDVITKVKIMGSSTRNLKLVVSLPYPVAYFDCQFKVRAKTKRNR